MNKIKELWDGTEMYEREIKANEVERFIKEWLAGWRRIGLDYVFLRTETEYKTFASAEFRTQNSCNLIKDEIRVEAV